MTQLKELEGRGDIGVGEEQCTVCVTVELVSPMYTLIKKENQIFLIYEYKEILNRAVAKSYMTNGLLIYGEIFSHFLKYKEALPHI